MVPKVAIKWPDGKSQSAANWDELEEVVRLSQYDIPEQDDFREHMLTRAKRWSGTDIDISGSADDFFWELERAGLLVRTSNGLIEPKPDNGEPYIVDLKIWRNANKTEDPFAEPEGKA